MNALEQAHAQATTEPYVTELAAKGFLASDATNLQTIANEIRTRNNLQENAKVNRPVSTQDRIVQYNSVWSQVKEINLASKVVYADNPAKLEQYMLYPNSSPNTRLNIIFTQEGEAVSNARVQLTNTALAAKSTDDRGLVNFESVNMPELLNISLTSESGETFKFTNQSIVSGTTNDLEIEVG